MAREDENDPLQDILLGDLKRIVSDEEVDDNADVDAKAVASTWTGKAPASELLELTAHAATDLGASEQLVERHGNNMRFVSELGWHAWTGTRWSNHQGIHLVNRFTAELCRHMSAIAATASSDAFKKHRGYWFVAGNRIDRIVHRAADHPSILVEQSKLDPNPMLFNCLSGTIDFNTFSHREHKRSDMITKIAPVRYNADAECPMFMRFLEQIFAPHPGVIDYIQRAIGYAMTGIIREHVIFICYGPTAQNGKTTLLETFRNILGDYGTTANASAFMQGGTSRFDSAEIVGARYVEASEVDKADYLSLPLIKRITGGDKIRVEKKFRDSFEYQPQCKVFMRTNRLPQMQDADDQGIWVRVRVIPFDVHFPEGRRDTRLPEKLKSEYQGIFAWMIQGAFRYLKEGLGGLPSSVERASAEYHEELNPILKFFKEMCIFGPNAKTEKKTFYILYTRWSISQNATPLNKKELEEQLKLKGVKWGRNIHSKDMYYYDGVEIRRTSG